MHGTRLPFVRPLIRFFPSVALRKKVKQATVCHPERSEGSPQLFIALNCGDASLRSA